MISEEQNFHDSQENNKLPNLLLFEFWEVGNSTIHRAVINNEPITSRGNVYQNAIINIALPESANTLSTVSISVPNIDYKIGRILNNAQKPVQCRIINASGLDYDVWLEDSLDLFVIQNWTANSDVVTGDLGFKGDLLLGYPFQAASVEHFPGLRRDG